MSFRGSEVLYQYFPGEGLQLHPLSTFKKANHMHGACERREAACDEAGLRRLLDEMERLAVRRSPRFIAWEYAFYFGGGSPPWMSAESNRDYHELVREFLASMCTRRLGDIYCDFAARYRGYQVDPPELEYTGPDGATEDELVPLRFTVSKLSAVEVRVLRGSKTVFSRLATVRRGTGAFSWRPRGPGVFRVELAAKELRTGLGKKDRTSAELAVANEPG